MKLFKGCGRLCSSPEASMKAIWKGYLKCSLVTISVKAPAFERLLT
ncbi:MAG: hypothetical protein NTY36_02100 [Deltaproteobacteria bacterium]|nr:hypothetical protein [Deltaproteobacteria bacterium]